MESFARFISGRHLRPGGVHFHFAVALCLLAIVTSGSSLGQTTSKKNSKSKTSNSQTELAKLRDEFVEATRTYKNSLEKLLASYEAGVTRAEDKLTVSQKLYRDGLIAKAKLDEYEQAVTLEKEKVAETKRQMASADSQIATVILEARADEELAKSLKRGSFVTTTALIRYNGSSGWSLSDSWRIQSFFSDAFKKSLPVAVFGQGAIHDRWRLDHRNAMDISLHPDSVEGQALLSFLQKNGIPFLAFRQAIPGTATGPHIHIGRPSHRY